MSNCEFPHTVSKHSEFFMRFGNDKVAIGRAKNYTEKTDFTIEELYQAFKARLTSELNFRGL